MCKRILSMISLMMVMTTLRAFDFPLTSLTSTIASNVTPIRDNEDEVDAITIRVDIDEAGQEDREKVVKLDVIGFQGDQVFFGDSNVTDTYKTLDLSKIQNRSFLFNCEDQPPSHMTGSIKYVGFDQNPEVNAYYESIPDDLKIYCATLGVTIERNRRLILV